MTTQSLRGMANHGPMHWRGDRTGGNDAPSAQPTRHVRRGRGVQEVQRRVRRAARPQRAAHRRREMQAFTDFILQVTYPPNPIRNLDNSLTPDQQAGREPSSSGSDSSDTFQTCNGCHALDPTATRTSASHARLLRHRRPVELRERDRSSSRSRTCATCTRRSACSACRRCRSSTPATTASRAIRCAASASCTTAASTRSSASTTRVVFNQNAIPPPFGNSGGFAGRPAAPADRGLHDGVRQQPGADRRSADHPHQDRTIRRRPASIPASRSSSSAPTPASAISSSRACSRARRGAASTSAAATSRATAPRRR